MAWTPRTDHRATASRDPTTKQTTQKAQVKGAQHRPVLSARTLPTYSRAWDRGAQHLSPMRVKSAQHPTHYTKNKIRDPNPQCRNPKGGAPGAACADVEVTLLDLCMSAGAGEELSGTRLDVSNPTTTTQLPENKNAPGAHQVILTTMLATIMRR